MRQRRWYTSGVASAALLLMSFTYDIANAPQISIPRLLVADTDATHPIFQDDEILAAYTVDSIAVFPPVGQGIAISYGNVSYRRAAAVLLDVLAANKARLASALEVLDIKLDASKASKELRATAQQLRDTEADSGAFAIAEMVNTSFAARERTWKQLLRINGG